MDGALLRRSGINSGLVAGFVVVYLCAVGMVGRFEVRNLVGDDLKLGTLLMVVPPLVAGYLLPRPRIRAGARVTPAPRDALAAAGLAGAIAGALVGGFLLMVHALGPLAVRRIFIRFDAGLLDIMQWGQGVWPAFVLWAGLGAALTTLAAGVRLLPESPRRALISGLATVLAISLLQRLLPPAMRGLGISPRWLYSPFGGLQIYGAFIVFGAAVGAYLGRRRWAPVARARVEALAPPGRTAFNLIGIAVIASFLVVLPTLVGPALTDTLSQVMIFVLLALGLNIVVGYAGLLDLGYVAFFAAGAYFTALFTGARLVAIFGDPDATAVFLEINFWYAVPLIILGASIVGLMIGTPVLRLRGDYLAIVTLGFGEIVRVLVTSNALRDFVGGAQGLSAIPPAPGFPRQPRPIYYLALIFVLVALWISFRLERSRIGRAWSAMREDEQVAEAMGVSTMRYKLLAFVMGAIIGSFGGALSALKIGTLTPASFGVLVSIIALAVIILGGMGSIPGVLVGSAVLIGLPELLTEFEEFRLLIYGAVLVAVMVLRPQGLIPNVRRSRELQDEERTQDQWLREQRAAQITTAGDEA